LFLLASIVYSHRRTGVEANEELRSMHGQQGTACTSSSMFDSELVY